MAWTPSSLVRRSPGARDPRVETEAGTKRPAGSRRAAREALEAEEAAREADRARKHALVRQVRYFADFSAGERKAVCEAMCRVDVRAGERVMTHLPLLERESRANSAAGKTSAGTFHQALLRAKQAKAKDANAKKKHTTSETRDAAFPFRRDDAWYVVAEGAVDVHVSVPGDACVPFPGDVPGDVPGTASSRSSSRLNWHRAFSKVKRRRDAEETPLGPKAATLRAGSFFGAPDEAFAADPLRAVVLVAARDTTLFAVPGERFVEEADGVRQKTKSKAGLFAFARGIAETKKDDDEDDDASVDENDASRKKNRARLASAFSKVVAFHTRHARLLDDTPMLSTALTPFQRALLIGDGSVTTLVRFAPFQTVARETDFGDACWVVADGDAHATVCVAGAPFSRETETTETIDSPEWIDSDAAIDSEVWKRAFHVGEGFGEACLCFARPPRSLAWETNVRAGVDGATLLRVDPDAFRELFHECGETIAKFDALVEASADDNTLGLSGLVTGGIDGVDGEENADTDTESVSLRGSHDGILSTPRESREGRRSTRTTSDAGAPSERPEASSSDDSDDSDADDSADAPSTPPTPSPRRPDARRERRPPPLVVVPRKHPRRLPRDSNPALLDDGLARTRFARDASPFCREEWETDSDEERRLAKDQPARDQERSALKTLGMLRDASSRKTKETDVSRRAVAKWSASTEKTENTSDALVAAFAKRFAVASFKTKPSETDDDDLAFFFERENDANKPLRRRAPLGPPPVGAERVARLLASLETHPLFFGVETRVLREAVKDLERKILQPGETLFKRGDTKRDYMYVVEAGELEGHEECPFEEQTEAFSDSSDVAASRDAGVARRTKNKKNAPAAVFRAGDVLGDAELIFSVARQRWVVASNRGAKLWGMRVRWFERLNAPSVRRRRFVARNVARPCPLVSSLPFSERRDVVELVAELGEPFRVETGDTVVAQGGVAERVFFVTSGSAEALVNVPELAAPLVVGTFGKGDVFGHLEFFLEEETDNDGDANGDKLQLSDDADLRVTCLVANRASVVATATLRGVSVDGDAFRAVARPGTSFRRALDAERKTFANGVA
jgi:CRP-like cAMP-binding protein